MSPPANPALYKFAFVKALVTRCQDFGNDLSFHDCSKFDRCRVGPGFVHSSPHVGLEGQIFGAEQKLAFGWNGQRSGLQAEIIYRREALGPCGKDDLAISVHFDPATEQAVRIAPGKRYFVLSRS